MLYGCLMKKMSELKCGHLKNHKPRLFARRNSTHNSWRNLTALNWYSILSLQDGQDNILQRTDVTVAPYIADYPKPVTFTAYRRHVTTCVTANEKNCSSARTLNVSLNISSTGCGKNVSKVQKSNGATFFLHAVPSRHPLWMWNMTIFFKKTETLHTRTKQYALYFRSVS